MHLGPRLLYRVDSFIKVSFTENLDYWHYCRESFQPGDRIRRYIQDRFNLYYNQELYSIKNMTGLDLEFMGE